MGSAQHVTGDLFAAPSNTILVHACNTQGSWGGGIAVAFHRKFPKAFEVYKGHCQANQDDDLVGTCLLIPASGADEKHDVACLFTSRRYGARKDTPQQILEATERALADLARQNGEAKALHACKFNSGRFGVPWNDTEAIITKLNMSMTVYTPDAETAAESERRSPAQTRARGGPSPRARGAGRGSPSGSVARGRGAPPAGSSSRGRTAAGTASAPRQMTLGAFGVTRGRARGATSSRGTHRPPQDENTPNTSSAT